MEADPSVVLEWLEAKNGDFRDLQLTALEQLCNEVLFSDNVDVFCERYPPRCFIPALCRIFLDEEAPATVLEANARALSYYLDMHLEWCNYMIQSQDVLRAIAAHLGRIDMNSNKSNEFGQQLLKMLKIICSHDATSLYCAGGLTPVLNFVRDNANLLHNDVLQAGMELIRRLFSKAGPSDPNLNTWILALSSLLDCKEPGVADQTLRAFASLVARFAQLGSDPSPLANPHIIDCLLHRLRVAGGVESSSQSSESGPGGASDSFAAPGISMDMTGITDVQGTRDSSAAGAESNPAVVHAVTNILITLCCSSTALTHSLLTGDGQFANTLAMVIQRGDDEAVVLSVLRLINILLVLLYQSPETGKLATEVKAEPKFKLREGSFSSPSTPIPMSSAQLAGPSDSLRECATPVPSAADSTTETEGVASATPDASAPDTSSQNAVAGRDREALHRRVIEAIKTRDTKFLKTSLESGRVDVNYVDKLGQSLLNWAASFGTPAIVELLCSHGANVDQGVCSSLAYAATFGRVDICRTLLALGADPDRPDDRGRRPVDRARARLPYPGCQQVVDLLETKSRRTSSAEVLPTSTPKSSAALTERIQRQSSTRAQHIFVHQLFPVLVALFKESVSPSIRRQCILLVRRMAIYVHSDHLEEISMLEFQMVPFAFLLTQMIYSVFIEETDEFILRALELSQCLLLKLPHLYVTVFYRLGLFPLISQMADIWIHLLPEGTFAEKSESHLAQSVAGSACAKESLSEETTDSLGESSKDTPESPSVAIPPNLPVPTGELKSNRFYRWNGWYLIWMGDLLSIVNPHAFVIVQLQPADGGLRALTIHGGENSHQIPLLLHPDEPAVERPGLKQHMLRMHQHLIDASENLGNFELWPSKETENAQQESSKAEDDDRCLARLLPRSLRGRLDVGKQNWRRLGPHLGLRRLPEVAFPHKSHGSHSAGGKSALERQASSPARACISGRSQPFGNLIKSSNAVTIGPAICSLREGAYGPRLCIQMRAAPRSKRPDSGKRSPVMEALLFSENSTDGFSRVRISPICPSASRTSETTQASGEVFEADEGETGISKDHALKQPVSLQSIFAKRRHSASLITLISEIDSELHSDGDKSSTDSSEAVGPADVPELFDFDVLFGLGTKSSGTEGAECSATSSTPSECLSKPSEVTKELQRLDEILFPSELIYETYNSGRLTNFLHTSEDGSGSDDKDAQERANQRLVGIRKQAYKLAKGVLRLMASETLSSSSSASSKTISPLASYGTLDELRGIVSDIRSAFQSDHHSQSSATLNALSSSFKRLADLLKLGERALTAYELAISGLVPALLLCLSAAHAGRWNCPVLPVGLDSTTSLLWYLQERRRVFIEHLMPRHGLMGLTCLARRTVEAFELVEHLPLRLFSLASYLRGRSGSDENTTKEDTAVKATSHSDTAPVNTTKRSLMSLPLGLIRSAAASKKSTNSNPPISMNEMQQFADCLDEYEISALPTFGSHLVSRGDSDFSIPGMHQVDGCLVLEVRKSETDSGEDKNTETEQISLTDLSNSNLKVSPLATVGQLEKFILKQSTKQWYEAPRSSLPFRSKIKASLHSNEHGLVFPPPNNGVNSIDALGGVIDWLATNAGTEYIEDWCNPAMIGLVTVAASISSLTLGRPAYILGPRAGSLVGGYPVRCAGVGAITRPRRSTDSNGGNVQRGNGKGRFGLSVASAPSQEVRAWFAVDLGLQLIPSAYSLAYLRQAESSNSPLAPRNWTLEGSNDGTTWTLLSSHTDDNSLQSLSGSRATWVLESLPRQTKTNLTPDTSNTSRRKHSGSDSYRDTIVTESSSRGWRFFKIQLTGPNANDGKELAIGGLEFYGTVCGVHESVLSAGQLAARVHQEAAQTDDIIKLNHTSLRIPEVAEHSRGRRKVNLKKSESPQDEPPAPITETVAEETTQNAEAEEVDTPTTEEGAKDESASCVSPFPAFLQQLSIMDSCPGTPKKVTSPETNAEQSAVDTKIGDESSEEEYDGPEEDAAEAEDNSQDNTLSERLTDGLDLLDISSSDENLLQYLDGLLSSDKSSDNILRLLFRMSAQDSSGDESPKKLSIGRPLPVPEVANQVSADSQPDATANSEEEREKSVISGVAKSTPHVEVEKTQSVTLSSEAAGSHMGTGTTHKAMSVSHVSGTGDSASHEGLWFIDQANKRPSPPKMVAGTFELNPEEAEAMEFGETVEAIIESNMSSNSPCLSHSLASRYDSGAGVPDKEHRMLGPNKWRSESCRKIESCHEKGAVEEKSEVKSVDWFVHNEADQEVVSEPELSSEPHKLTPWQGDTKIPKSPVVHSACASNSAISEGHSSEALKSSPIPGSPVVSTTASETKVPPKVTSSGTSVIRSLKAACISTAPEERCKITIFTPSKSGRQIRRRPRRPRPRPIAPTPSAHEFPTSQSKNSPAQRAKPLQWDEASDSLRFPPGLIPVFNPNPGFTNAPATTPFVLCHPPTSDVSTASKTEETSDIGPHLSLFLSAMAGSKCAAEVPMRDPNSTVFEYIEYLYEKIQWDSRKNDSDEKRSASLPTADSDSDASNSSSNSKQPKNYTLRLSYRVSRPEERQEWSNGPLLSSIKRASQGQPYLNYGDQRLTPSLGQPIVYDDSGVHVTMVTDETEQLSAVDIGENEFIQSHTNPETLLQLLKILHQLSGISEPKVTFREELAEETIVKFTGGQDLLEEWSRTTDSASPTRSQSKLSVYPSVQMEDFVSGRLTRKLLRQIHDPLSMASRTLPHWCFSLSHRLTPLFSFESRLELLKACAFGPARAVIWLQNQPLDKNMGIPPSSLSRSHSVGSSASSGVQQSAAHTFILSSLMGNADENSALGLSTGISGSGPEVLFLRPSALSQLQNSSNSTNSANALEDSTTPTTTEAPLFESLANSLGLNLPPSLSGRSHFPRELSDLWNCLLVRAIRNNGQIGGQLDNKSSSHVGRLHKEFVRVPRLPREIMDATERSGARLNYTKLEHEKSTNSGVSSSFWDWASCLMEEHASRKSELEIQFIGEDGTGLGPTLEFYSLLAAELRRRDGLMWVVDDVMPADQIERDHRPALPTVASVATLENQSKTNLSESNDAEPLDFGVEAYSYVNTAHGLFPAPWPADKIPARVLHRFYILGITVGKCLQDNRRIDLPLSPPLLKLLSAFGAAPDLRSSVTSGPIGSAHLERSEDSGLDKKLSWKDASIALADAERATHTDFSVVADAESVLTTILSDRSDAFLSEESSKSAETAGDLGQFILSPQYRRLYRAAEKTKNKDEGSSRSAHWLSNLLGLEDFCLIYPERAHFFRQILQFCRKKYQLTVRAGPHHLDSGSLERLALDVFGSSLEDMCLSMEFLPTSKMFGYSALQLRDEYDWEDMNTKPNARSDLSRCDSVTEDEPVSVNNIEIYLSRTLEFCLDKGIRKQMDAFRAGFERVLPMSWLAVFNGTELGQLIAGDSVAQWSREDLLTYTVPCFGFTHQSPTYQMLINILSSFNLMERRAFLQFTTGCSSLPPGGLKNLHPRLRVVRKETSSGAFPSVNTCVHYLKLPEYETEEELRSVLLRATREIGFYLN
ncbi:unnamed protein product [Calicophoron daubneyi]|uniref:E3 ubiquitin-protein ligase n=1 Tax=Calicophoron daubneyi TaxID=300641 RepID=A0AAV2U1L0_CALDB